MISVMLAPLLAIGLGLSAEVSAKEALIEDAKARLLDGRDLAPETELQLRAMKPAERLEVLIFLRRSGMLTGPVWPVERLLAPETPITGGGP